MDNRERLALLRAKPGTVLSWIFMVFAAVPFGLWVYGILFFEAGLLSEVWMLMITAFFGGLSVGFSEKLGRSLYEVIVNAVAGLFKARTGG